jgi:hypothetical protein
MKDGMLTLNDWKFMKKGINTDTQKIEKQINKKWKNDYIYLQTSMNKTNKQNERGGDRKRDRKEREEE